jgi:23S rRNA pseudouridine1911/1915/1917 synthase
MTEYPVALSVSESNIRLDHYVSNHVPDLSRAAIQRLIDSGFVLVDGVRRKSSYKVRVGETVAIYIPSPVPPKPRAEKIPLDILYEDDDLLVVNKLAGMVVHPAAGHSDGTLVNAILAHCPQLNVGGVERPGIVHRLDADTSGIIVVAKNDMAMQNLQAQFKSRHVHKTYLTLAEGTVKPPHGKIDASIGRDPNHRQKMAVVTRGKTRASVTIYHTLANLAHSTNVSRRGSTPETVRYTLVQAEPQTGRTHQIRVHLAFLGFPVVGDKMYGREKNSLELTRQFLHAWKITFTLPSDGRAVNFTAPLPNDLLDVLNILGYAMENLK